MAYSPNQKYPGATNPDPNYKDGIFRDNNPSTTNNGSPLKAIDRNELLARDEAIMNDAGFEYNGLPDTPQDSQLFKAYKASLGNGANLLSNHNFLIPSPDDSQPAPSATPTSYPPGFQIFSNVFADETVGITNLTYIDGRVSFSGGSFYMPVANTGAIERVTEFAASVADFDGKPRTRGVSFALVGDEYRVTVGVDALEDSGGNATPLGSVKFEQGSVATGHEVLPSYIVDNEFENITEMISSFALVGETYSTKGYYYANDGGGATYIVENGDTSEGVFDHYNGSVTFKIQPKNNEVNMLQAGIKADGGVTINSLSPVSDYANLKGLNVRLNNDGSTRVHFNDLFHLKNTRLVSDTSSHIHYKTGGSTLRPDEPCVIFGNGLDIAHPEYFESEKEFQPGEGLTFSPGQGFGEVLFRSGGKVYYRWARELITDSLPTTGTVSGIVSGNSESYTPSTLGSRDYGDSNDSGFDNVYLSCDIIGNPQTAHVQATGVMVNGMRNGRRFGGGHSLSVEGFETAGLMVFNWFGTITGTLEANKCADGFFFSYDNNSFNVNRMILVCGTPYSEDPKIQRYRAIWPSSTAVSIGVLDLESNIGSAPFRAVAWDGGNVDVINVEDQPDFSVIEIDGSPSIYLMDNANRDSEIVKQQWFNAAEFGPLWGFESRAYKLGSHIQGLEIGSISHTRKVAGTSDVPEAWSTFVDAPTSRMIIGLKLNGAYCNTFDAAESFRLTAQITKNAIIYDESNYKITNYNFCIYKPNGVTTLSSRNAIDGNQIRYTIEEMTVSSVGPGPISCTIQALQDTETGESESISSPNNYAYVKPDELSVWFTSDYVRTVLTGLPSSEDLWAYSVKISELRIN